MGVDLRLLPVDCLHQNPGCPLWGFSHNVLSLPRRREAWNAIAKLATETIPEMANISSYTGAQVPDGTSEGETMYGRLTKDAYGAPYEWIRAGILKPTLREFFAGEPATAYVEAMRDDALIILDWH